MDNRNEVIQHVPLFAVGRLDPGLFRLVIISNSSKSFSGLVAELFGFPIEKLLRLGPVPFKPFVVALKVAPVVAGKLKPMFCGDCAVKPIFCVNVGLLKDGDTDVIPSRLA